MVYAGAWDVTRDMVLCKEEYKSRKGKKFNDTCCGKNGLKMATIRLWGNSGRNIRTNIALSTQVVPSHVFPVSPVVVPTVLVRLLSVTCAVPVVCSPQPRFGASGT